MPAPPGTFRRSAACFAAAIVGVLVAASSALAISPPGGLSSNPPSPSQSGDWTFGWTAAQPDIGFQVIDYEGGLAGGEGTLGPDLGEAFGGLGEGTHTFQVRAVEQSLLDPAIIERSGFASITVRVDRTPPKIVGGLAPPSPGADGWYQSLTIVFLCTDPGGSGIAACIGNGPVSTQGANQTRTGTAVDRVGLSAQAVSPAFNFDALGPPGAQSPSPGGTSGSPALLNAEPTFTWSASRQDGTSGLAAEPYEVWLNGRPVGGRRSATSLGPAQYPTLAEGPLHQWWVRTYDKAGNYTTTAARYFRINSAAAPKPAFTGGPSGPTNDATPTFEWTGEGPSFGWEVLSTTGEQAVQSGTTTAKSVTLAGLADGGYTFKVESINAFGTRSLTAERSFQVDTVAPPAPVITARPPFPTNSATPAFAWTADETVAAFRYQVIGSGGSMAQGPADVPEPNVVLKPLGPGAYSFRVTQIDPAGNVSPPTSDPFAIVGPSSAVGGSLSKKSLPTKNAKRLRPRAGALLKTRTPVLQWVRGPKGTKVYNLQLFRVVKRRVGRAPIVKKVYSGFPKGTQYRLPKAKVKPGTCYVWRIWPYLGTRFTPEPLGISNFCVASKKALAKAAQARKQRRLAANQNH